jgi:cob(I)alamin adenosyltransferase
MRIYTRTGDDGRTGLYGGGRVNKDDVRIEAYGTVDELNAALGIVRTWEVPMEVDQVLQAVQNELFSLGAELATPQPDEHGTRFVDQDKIKRLETSIDRLDGSLPPLTQFILPSGSQAASALHLARCICRRAERRVVTLSGQNAEISPLVVEYLNRLGDLLFVLARVVNAGQGVADQPWTRPDVS